MTVHAKLLRLELLKVKADLERELGQLVLNCSDCGRTVHWVSGLGVEPGYWEHREAAPHDEPAVQDRTSSSPGPSVGPDELLNEVRSFDEPHKPGMIQSSHRLWPVGGLPGRRP